MFDFFIENMWITWLLTAVVFTVLEAVTTSLISIWFVPGSILVSIMSVWVEDISLQIIAFIILSAVCLLFCRRFFKKSNPEQLDDTNNKLIGKTATAKTDISSAEGKVLIGDVYWRAVSDVQIEEGDAVTVTAVNGNLLTVDKK